MADETSAENDVVDEEFYNPYHNPKTGKFTSKTNGSGGTVRYVPMSKAAAKSYRKAGKARAQARLRDATLKKIYKSRDTGEDATARRVKNVAKQQQAAKKARAARVLADVQRKNSAPARAKAARRAAESAKVADLVKSMDSRKLSTKSKRVKKAAQDAGIDRDRNKRIREILREADGRENAQRMKAAAPKPKKQPAPKKTNRWDEVQARTMKKMAAKDPDGSRGQDAMKRLQSQRLRDSRRG